MTDAIAPTPDADAGTAEPIDFTLVPVTPRRHGWTAERQRAFIEALAEMGCVSDACERVGLTPQSAYRLRRRPGAEAFDRAWDQALLLGVQRLTGIAFERAVHGSFRTIRYRGEVIGEERVPSDRLLIFLLKHLDPMRYGKLSGLLPVKLPDPHDQARALLPETLDELVDLDEAPAEKLTAQHYAPVDRGALFQP